MEKPNADAVKIPNIIPCLIFRFMMMVQNGLWKRRLSVSNQAFLLPGESCASKEGCTKIGLAILGESPPALNVKLRHVADSCDTEWSLFVLPQTQRRPEGGIKRSFFSV